MVPAAIHPPLPLLEDEDAFTSRARIKRPEGLRGLLQAEAVRDQASQGNAPLGDPPRAFFQAPAGESPGPVKGQVAVDDIRARLQGHRPSFPHEAGSAEHPCTPHHLRPRDRMAGAVEGCLRPLPPQSVPESPPPDPRSADRARHPPPAPAPAPAAARPPRLRSPVPPSPSPAGSRSAPP